MPSVRGSSNGRSWRRSGLPCRPLLISVPRGCRIRLLEVLNRPGLDDADRKELREVKKRMRLLEQENEVLRRAAAYLSQANLPGK